MPPLTLAWSNLTQQRLRTLISVIGIAFAVLLIFMQLGFQDAVRRTATLLYDQLDFDLVLTSTEYSNLARPAAFSRRRLAQARAVPGVERALPLTAVLGLWTQPRRLTDPESELPHKWSIMVLAVDPARLDELFRRPFPEVFRAEADLRRDAVQLARLDTVLMDRTSSPPYGDVATWNRVRYNDLNDRRVEIIGDIKLGTGFAYSGLLMTSESTLTHLMRWPDDRISFGLLKLAPDVDVESARAEIEARLGSPQESGVEVRTRKEINDKEIDFWMSGTAVGQFFTAGVVIALLVGGVFVYQMMASDISRRLPEYATIRALGYPREFLSHVVYWQGFLLALLGYVPGLAASLLGYLITHRLATVPIEMTLWRATYVLALTVFMCMGSALVAVRSAHTANPADLF